MTNKLTAIFCVLYLLHGCSPSKEKRAELLYESYCASCHVLPKIEELPKHIWENSVLPEMGARMGVLDSTYNPLEKLSFEEQGEVIKSGIYPRKPIIEEEDWKLLHDYIIRLSPDSIPSTVELYEPMKLKQFAPLFVDLDSTNSTLISLLKYDTVNKGIITGDLNGTLLKYDSEKGKIESLISGVQAPISYIENDGLKFITSIGYLNPSEKARGYIQITDDKSTYQLPNALHRPVHTLLHDFNADGENEIVVCEFGNLTGELSILKKKDQRQYQKETLINLPGAVRAIAKDMNGDGKDDLIVLTSQGKEGIFILYQETDLKFKEKNIIQFSPVYGLSWFDLIDYDGDGDLDIITVNGDNADKSYVQKWYHGMRIFINNGNDEFEEKYFYSLNGATKVISNDFDLDGDIDFAIVSTFPDYGSKDIRSFVYLENENSSLYSFKPYTLEDAKLGRWLLMDSGDFDNDGDEDIVLSAFSYVFTPVPNDLKSVWENSNSDLMILENKTNSKF